MEEEIVLASLPIGQTGIVESMNLSGVMRRRLQDLGMIPGTQVTPTKKSPGKGPTAYRVRDSVYALRLDDAKNIRVTVL